MKYSVFSVIVVATTAFAASPASSKMSMCSGDHLSKMTTMVGGMPDSPHKWEMYKHLAMVNTAMSKNGMPGCEMVMKTMLRRLHMHHMSTMKQGKM